MVRVEPFRSPARTDRLLTFAKVAFAIVVRLDEFS